MEKFTTVFPILLVCLFAAFSFALIPQIGDFNCNAESCDAVICPSVNCTYGKLMNSPSSQCSCCKTCLNYIGENETCGPILSDRECGPGLVCLAVNGNASLGYRCSRMETPCFLEQDVYDKKLEDGEVGMYESRPNCDGNGDYMARKCLPGGSCYCIDKNNARIFGESPPNNASEMNCACARDYETSSTSGLVRTAQFPHCLPNGNYDTFQCIAQACFCINPGNLSTTTAAFPITDSENLPCYKPDIHYPKYFRPCEVERNKIISFTQGYTRQNVTIVGVLRSECSPDGFYLPIRETPSTMYCADPYGNKIEDFEIPNTNSTAATMNCQCARTRYWLSNQNLAKPQCCSNGNFKPTQCRGGVCFCVDSSGNQLGIEVQENNQDKLDCSEHVALLSVC